MKTGKLILIPFPFAELTNVKVRPAVVIAVTKDSYKDIIVCAVSSVVPQNISQNEFVVQPTAVNKLKVTSVVKVDRIVTLKEEDIIAELGKLTSEQLSILISKFKGLVDG